MRCLDLFSGSGALGFEAASRGAARVVMVEKNRQVAEVLRSNLQLLGANTIDVQCMDALHYMKGRQERFDVVFLDPPYDSGLLRDVLPGMSELLTPQGVVYLEARDWPELEGWEVLREGKAGLVHYALICRPGSKEETS